MRPLRTISAALWKRQRALPRARLPDDIVLFNGAHDRLLLGNGAGQRLLTVDIFFAVRGRNRYQRMPVIGHRNHHRVNIVARQQFAIVVIGLAILVPIARVDGVDCGLQMILVQIAGGNDLAVRCSEIPWCWTAPSCPSR